jgi:hypothetical protein
MFMPDLDLQYISKFCASLQDLNLKACISVTDVGISNLLCKCMKLHSIVVCDTSFGIKSVLALCSSISDHDNDPAASFELKHNSLAFNLQKLHMGGCKGKCYFLHVTLSAILSRWNCKAVFFFFIGSRGGRGKRQQFPNLNHL